MQKSHLVIGAMLITTIGFATLGSLQVVSADGYSPLALPERGNGPASSVQGESIQKAPADPSSNDAASPSASPKAASSATPTDDDISGSYTGTVKSVQDGKLVIDVNGKDRTVDVPNDMQVTRDGQNSSLNEVQQGDSVTVERDDQGKITEVRVASQQSMNFWRTFLPVLLVALAGFYLLTRKRSANKA